MKACLDGVSLHPFVVSPEEVFADLIAQLTEVIKGENSCEVHILEKQIQLYVSYCG